MLIAHRKEINHAKLNLCGSTIRKQVNGCIKIYADLSCCVISYRCRGILIELPTMLRWRWIFNSLTSRVRIFWKQLTTWEPMTRLRNFIGICDADIFLNLVISGWRSFPLVSKNSFFLNQRILRDQREWASTWEAWKREIAGFISKLSSKRFLQVIIQFLVNVI